MRVVVATLVAATMLINLANSRASDANKRMVDRISRFVFPLIYFVITGLVVGPGMLGG